ncbi:hypothetical protein BG005_000738, partial [Podila minutissima]
AGAGLVVVFNTTRTLPKSTDLAVTLECDNLEPLWRVLSGIATTFANPLVNKILESLSPADRMRRSQWDRELMAVTEARERDMSSDDHWVFTQNAPDNTRSTFRVEFVEFEP